MTASINGTEVIKPIIIVRFLGIRISNSVQHDGEKIVGRGIHGSGDGFSWMIHLFGNVNDSIHTGKSVPIVLSMLPVLGQEVFSSNTHIEFPTLMIQATPFGHPLVPSKVVMKLAG